ncbi:unnamed protein product [Rotaria sp. Silwood1]|nr:unnamed protein product [Rotaria sp. Silwood1]
MYNIECQIQLTEKQEISLTLTGIKKNVKTVREIITNLFESTQIKIYDKENIDQPMIYWSKTIRSDLIILVIQQIMDHHNIFTLWEKTAMFSGYFKVVYLTHESFLVSETKITEILRNEIAYVEDIVMPCEKTKNFLNDIDQFILARQDPELAIIRCKYPYKLDIKISLFGRKSVVKKAKKQLQSIINKHTIKIFPLRITTNQQDYLLENCTEQLKDLEHEYKDDCLRIRIRDKEFSAPQYLIDRIQEKIKRLFIQTSTFQYQKLGDSLQITDENYKKLNQIAQYNYCRIEKIETKAEMKAYSVPKALSPTLNISSSIIEQSNEFISSLSMRKIAILNGSIEIYLANETSSILLMSEIFKHKSSLRIPPPVIPRTSKPTNDRSKQMNLNAYNIYFSCCEQDQTFCNRITSYLIGEGYSVCETSSNSSQFQSFIDKCDVILISFNENYFKNKYSNMELNYAKLKGKQLLPFLRYTKPGVTGKIYSETAVLPKLTENKEDNEERAFGNKSIALQKVTSEQRHERETSYRKYLTKTIENEKIPTDELRESSEDLTKVINDLERTLREDPYTELPVESYEWYGRREGNLPLDELTSYYIREFLNSVKRWLNKSTNAIRGNIIPFTPTGDINDAIFVIDQPSYSKLFEKNFLSFDHSPPNQYFSPFKSNPGSCFNHEESQDYYQKLIQSSRPINSIEAIMEDNDTAWDTVSLYHTPIDVDEDDIDIERKTLDEIKKLEKLDNPNRVWKNTRNAEKFIQQKIKNILELKELCEKST